MLDQQSNATRRGRGRSLKPRRGDAGEWSYSREEDGPSKASYYGLVVSTDDANGAVDGTRSPGLAAHVKLMLHGGDCMVSRDIS